MPVASPRKIFVNLSVQDLDRSMDFFKQLGFDFDPQFTDEKAACMVLSDDGYVMLLVDEFFRTFTTKELCDATIQAEVILAISADSREQVDQLVGSALAAGARPANDPVNHGFMYAWSFHDLDGHMWEVLWMDPEHVEQ